MEFDNPFWEEQNWVCVENTPTLEELLRLVEQSIPPEFLGDDEEWILEDIDYVI